MQTMDELVNHPDHYKSANGIECIEAIESVLTPEEYLGYLRANCMKYLWRCREKGNMLQDLKKAQWYLNRLVHEIEYPDSDYASDLHDMSVGELDDFLYDIGGKEKEDESQLGDDQELA